MKNNERNAGRKKKTNEAYTVRCHPKVIAYVRKYAKEKTEEYNHSDLVKSYQDAAKLKESLKEKKK